MRLRANPSQRFFIRVDPRKSVAQIFLNCTKNTELTGRHFNRTFSFALNKNLTRSQPPTVRGSDKARQTKISTRIGETLSNMKAATQWITYRTRFLVQAKQLSTNLRFTDALGRQHAGSKGDYLVEFSDGAFRITPRQIFEDIYVPLLSTDSESTTPRPPARNAPPRTSAPGSTHVGTDAFVRPAEPSSAASIQRHLA
jgi:hypothetical protein